MAKFQTSSIMKMIRKSVGNETYCRSRGSNIVKSKIMINTSKTELQQQQRAKWATYIALTALFDDAIIIGFPSRARTQTAHNAFIQANKDVVTVDEDLKTTVDDTKIVCSAGNLTMPVVSVTADAENHKLTFTHEAAEYSRRAQKTDQLYALVVEAKKEEAKLYKLNTREDDSPVEISMPQKWSMDGLCIYAFVLSKDRSKASKSVYLQPEG